MSLKSIDLQGYKTFAGRTTFEFAGAITCIVGPNGSGKSNIADAIRWVLGEQSFRLLRGKKTADMIFAGSESRARAGMASANINFDNTSGWLPVDFSEVSIARRAYRDGTNEYLLNGQRVRLRDITELLASSGLSERTYTVIGQGLVDAALSLRAEERRRLFEEAAGIGLYRSRREEAIRRLDTTFRNIERVEDILAELRPRLRSLERQARRAERYGQVERDLKELLRDYYGFHWYRAQQNLNQARENARVQESMYEAVQLEQSGLDQKLSSFREQIQSLRARLASWHRDSSQLHTQRETITREQAVSDERVRSLSIQKSDANTQLLRLDDQILLYQERVNDAEETKKVISEELAEARSQVQSANQALESRQAEQENAINEVKELRQEIDTQRSNKNRLQAHLVERHTYIERQQAALEKTILTITETDKKCQDAEVRLVSAQTENDQVEAVRHQVENQLREQRETLERISLQRNEAADLHSNLRTELAGQEAQIDVLDQAEKALTGYANGTQLLLKSAQKGELGGTQGILSSQLDVPEELEPAIVAALGDYLDAVILEGKKASDDALELLIQHTTRGSLLPVTSLTPPTPIKKPDIAGIIGVASDVVQVPPLLRPAVDLLLGQTLVVQDRKAARISLRGQKKTTRAVTLRGEVFHAGGQISVGQRGETTTISRPRQRRELSVMIKKIRQQVASLELEIRKLEADIDDHKDREATFVDKLNNAITQGKGLDQRLHQCSLEMDRLKRQFQWQNQQRDQIIAEIKQGESETQQISNSLFEIEGEISRTQEILREKELVVSGLSVDELTSQVNYWQTQTAVAERSLAGAEVQHNERTTALQAVVQSREEIANRITVFERTLDEIGVNMGKLRAQETEIIEKIEALRILIDPAEAEMKRLDGEQDDLQDTEAKARKGLSVADHRHSQAQLTFTRKQENLDNLRDRIENDLGLVSFEYDGDISGPKPLPLGEMVEYLPEVAQLPEGMEETIKRQRVQLRRMGLVNPEAQTEFKEVKERFEFMTNQIEDLRKAENDIKDVISELDLLMKREFNQTFEQVAEEFRVIFTRLFGGGSARLVLTDPNDLSQTGIEIEARLPGRRSQGLSLLSGGERSLTAAALVFSLLKVSPTPFCVLDEVDAMLDEANVSRFRELLRELAENTQFIVITHNRNTVQAADVIYGVTMGRDSVSQMISLKLDEVAEVV